MRESLEADNDELRSEVEELAEQVRALQAFAMV